MDLRNGAFFASLHSFLDEADKQAKVNTREILFAGWQGLISASPVDLGSFRGNWYATVNDIHAEVSGNTEPRPYPDPDFKMGDTVFLCNALPYAMRIESGWSKQAPQGVVGPTRRALMAKLKQ